MLLSRCVALGGSEARRRHAPVVSRSLPPRSRSGKALRRVSTPGSYASGSADSNGSESVEAQALSVAAGNGSTVQDVFDAVGIELEDDLSPLRAALSIAEKRVADCETQREALETEAQEVCEVAIQAKDLRDTLREQLDMLRRDMGKLEVHCSKMEKQLDVNMTELRKLLEAQEAERQKQASSLQADAYVSVDSMAEGLPASTSEWDAEEGTAPGKDSQLSATEKQITERRAAILIIEARIRTFSDALSEMPAKISSTEERLAIAEAAYEQAETVASSAMQTVEVAVKDELESRAVASQIRDAIENATRSLKALGRLPAEPAPTQPEPELTTAVVASDGKLEMDMYTTSNDDEEEQAQPTMGARLMANLPWVALGAAVVALLTCTALRVFILDECHTVSVFLHKISATLSAIVSPIVEKVPWPQPHHGEEGLWQTIALLATSVVSVPLVMKVIPGGSGVLGFLIGGAVIGPHGLGVISNVEGISHIAEMGVVFLLFNIGLELSLERLQAMAKLVFGMGGLQFVVTTLAIASVAIVFGGYTGPAAIILGGALSLSSTAVAMQVMHDRQESGSRHGRATFAVLLLQDLAVVVLLMLVPLLANGSGGLVVIAKALGVAAVKAAACIGCMIAGGRIVLRPVFRRISGLADPVVFAATTLLVVLGSSVLTQIAGLSLALGAFLAGLLIAETEYALQVESDIAPFKGLLMGLFFMSVGMEISLGVLVQNWVPITASLVILLVGKTAIMAALGPPFGISRLGAVRSGLYLAPGGEFAFVALQEAVACGLIAASQIPQLFIMVVLSMALTPYLAELGAYFGRLFESKDVQLLQPSEAETMEFKNHVVIMGFGRVGQTIAQLLSERLIPFVALDVRPDRVAAGKAADLPVFFGDAGSPAVLHLVGAERARCAVITLDTPGANYRAVWAMHKHFPNAKIYVRAHDINHGLNLEKAGATAVVPEILEPSLQLAAAVLSSMNLKQEEISDAIDDFRRSHLSELSNLTAHSGGSLGYGFGGREQSSLESAKQSAAAPGGMNVMLAKPA